MKDVRFLGSSREDLSAMPASVRSRAGHELFMVQLGREPSDFKPMPDVGAGLDLQLAKARYSTIKDKS